MEKFAGFLSDESLELECQQDSNHATGIDVHLARQVIYMGRVGRKGVENDLFFTFKRDRNRWPVRMGR